MHLQDKFAVMIACIFVFFAASKGKRISWWQLAIMVSCIATVIFVFTAL